MPNPLRYTIQIAVQIHPIALLSTLSLLNRPSNCLNTGLDYPILTYMQSLGPIYPYSDQPIPTRFTLSIDKDSYLPIFTHPRSSRITLLLIYYIHPNRDNRSLYRHTGLQYKGTYSLNINTLDIIQYCSFSLIALTHLLVGYGD